MTEFFLSLSLFPLILTVGTYQIGLWCRKKWDNPICNPILISLILVVAVLLLTGISADAYQEGMAPVSWLLTPATVCLALPLYEQLKLLKKSLPAIFAGIAAGTVTSLVSVFLLCRGFDLDLQMTVSLLPKSITTAMGAVLSEQNGGVASLTTVAIIVSGILGSLSGTLLCRLLKLTDPIAQGVAIGTSAHVIGTTRAFELSEMAGAVGSLSLTIAGISTSVLLSFLAQYL